MAPGTSSLYAFPLSSSCRWPGWWRQFLEVQFGHLRVPSSSVPSHPKFDNYRKAFDYIPFWLYFRNSVIVSAATICRHLVLVRARGLRLFYPALAGKRPGLFHSPSGHNVALPGPDGTSLRDQTRDLHFLGTLLPLIVPPFFGQYIVSTFSPASLAIFLLRQLPGPCQVSSSMPPGSTVPGTGRSCSASSYRSQGEGS